MSIIDWLPGVTYGVMALTRSPLGKIVRANQAHTSGNSYDDRYWDIMPVSVEQSINALNETIKRAPGRSGLPVVAGTLPTITVGAANAASTITSAKNWPTVITVNSVRTFNSKVFSVYGTIPTIGTVYPDYTGITSNDNLVNLTSPLDNQVYAVEFYTDASQFDINVKDNSTLRILSDNAYIYGTDTAYGWKGSASGSLYNINVNFGSRVFRKITVELNGDSRFIGVNTGPVDSVYPTIASNVNIVVFGDSFTEPTIRDSAAYPNTLQSMGFPWRLGQMLGIKNTITSGSGGAGFLTTGPNSRPTFPTRSQNDIGKFQPNAVVMHTGLNDTANLTSGTYTQAQFQTAVEQTILNVWSVSPATRIYLSLNGVNGNTLVTGMLMAYNAFKAVSSKYPGQVYFLDRLTPSTIYSGTGKVGGTTGSGNADIMVGDDGTHPSVAGHIYLAHALYAAITETVGL